MPLRPHEYRELLRDALPIAQDADTSFEPKPESLFTPEGHRIALDPDVTVVRGARGVGKTVWFKALQDETLRRLAADEYQFKRLNKIKALPGYGLNLNPESYPSQRVLNSLLAASCQPEDIWTTVVLNALGAEPVRSMGSWDARVAWLRDNPEAVDQALSRANQQAAEEGVTKLLLFDALERLHPERRQADRLVVGILKLALELRTTTSHLRAKVFIRHDMFDDALLNFPDASKLSANATSLTWSPTNLYGLLFNVLGNSAHPSAEHFRSSTGRWRHDLGRYVPPREIVGDQDEQKKLISQIAGPYMGKDHRKGHTYTWLPNHLADGQGQVSPRSFLIALSAATEETGDRFAHHEFALHWDAIRKGVQLASQTRVNEISEDIPWVRTAIHPLRDCQVPIEKDEVVAKWTAEGLSARLVEAAHEISDEKQLPTGPRHEDYAGLIQELMDLGVMTQRANGKLDLPDVYRIAFGIGRKGGVPRLRPQRSGSP
ncbi:hypothetical protein [Goodfellowiella coeruleoviolacea]|uniref:Uncharacterized protein n=1 Tax=Goodfellowiella coeruleoviolacea TaxID=334858 RepID=A0AAE3GBW8_9PSEU|nr:hypothetical protein [Goodfellowiella coeruleoviolacea]MCP2164559.1 hypothetical protein [Goodfellowiella coeruleoviolacea]